MAKYSAPRGTQDILPAETPRWQYVESKFREQCNLFGYREVRTPTFEDTELFTRSIGEQTDIVGKEMYTFEDRGGRSITLRPEGTAPAVRAYVEHGMASDYAVNKLYYVGRIFRYERPQAGRYREHNQLGVESFGSPDPAMDVEVISLAESFFKSLGMTDLTLKINSLGCPDCRQTYREALKKFLEPLLSELCPTCGGRFDGNPLRVLDCKDPKCKELVKNAPAMLDYQDPECAEHFEKVKRYLDIVGIQYVVDPRLVRGLDYYTRTVFEFITTVIGGEITVCGGGRYDRLVEEIGGPSTPAAGFGLGIERLLLTLNAMGIILPIDSHPKAFVATMGDEAREEGIKLLLELRQNNIAAETDYSGKSLKAQMKLADKLQAEYAIILGEEEVKQRTATVRDMKTKEQSTVRLNEIVSSLSRDQV